MSREVRDRGTGMRLTASTRKLIPERCPVLPLLRFTDNRHTDQWGFGNYENRQRCNVGERVSESDGGTSSVAEKNCENCTVKLLASLQKKMTFNHKIIVSFL